ncbi:MAG: calcium-binding protein [Nitrospiraceae bacterium]
MSRVGEYTTKGEGNGTDNGRSENDILVGTTGPDTINGWEGDDTLRRGAGTDTLIGGFGNDQLDGGAGADSLYGGVGNDTYYIDSVGDQTVELLADAAGGVDLVRSTVSHTLGYGIEHLTLTSSTTINGTGNTLHNILHGNSANNMLSGLDGNDLLAGFEGNDTLTGGKGNDVLRGGNGRDQLNGGAGNDRFDYDAVSESQTGTGRDVITGFAGAGTALGDQIDLFTIDANVLVTGNQAFTWNGATPGGAGTLWYTGGVVRQRRWGCDAGVPDSVGRQPGTLCRWNRHGYSAVNHAAFSGGRLSESRPP